MQTALDLWPTVYIGLWAYPVYGWLYFSRRRYIRELTSLVLGHNYMDVPTETCAWMLRMHIQTMGTNIVQKAPED